MSLVALHNCSLYKTLDTFVFFFYWRFSEVATGRSDVPYDALDTLGVQVYGMPAGVPFHSPLLYNQQQLQQILANLEKIVFLKVSSQAQQVVVRLVLYAVYCRGRRVSG